MIKLSQLELPGAVIISKLHMNHHRPVIHRSPAHSIQQIELNPGTLLPHSPSHLLGGPLGVDLVQHPLQRLGPQLEIYLLFVELVVLSGAETDHKENEAYEEGRNEDEEGEEDVEADILGGTFCVEVACLVPFY